MMRTPSFPEDQLRAICKVMGDTELGLTNSEIDQLLRSSNIIDPNPRPEPNPYFYTIMSKKDRLYTALSKRQEQDNCGNNVANFIEVSMSPVRYAASKHRFDFLSEELNKVLSFSGLLIGEDGKLRIVPRVATVSEAQRRASKLKSGLMARNVHPDVLVFCKAELLQDNYFHAVFEATKSVAEKIRKKSGIDADGSNLVEEAFGQTDDRPPKLAFNSFQTETEKGEQRGLVNLLKGMFGTFRNVTAHAPKVTWTIDERDALDLLSLTSFLHRRIDASKPYGIDSLYKNMPREPSRS